MGKCRALCLAECSCPIGEHACLCLPWAAPVWAGIAPQGVPWQDISVRLAPSHHSPAEISLREGEIIHGALNLLAPTCPLPRGGTTSATSQRSPVGGLTCGQQPSQTGSAGSQGSASHNNTETGVWRHCAGSRQGHPYPGKHVGLARETSSAVYLWWAQQQPGNGACGLLSRSCPCSGECHFPWQTAEFFIKKPAFLQ